MKKSSYSNIPNYLKNSPSSPILTEILNSYVGTNESRSINEMIKAPLKSTRLGYTTGHYDSIKNQYRPVRKGISNMIRLHATGAIAMPTEIRLHILASSRDIIHSWAIPSAGIKIDCIPGYSSHRVSIFLVSGVF